MIYTVTFNPAVDYVIHLEDGKIKDSYFLNDKGNEKLKDYFCDNQI